MKKSPTDRLDTEMKVTFDVDELASFFEAFVPMDAHALFDEADESEDVSVEVAEAA